MKRLILPVFVCMLSALSTDSTAQTECATTAAPTQFIATTLDTNTESLDGVVYDSGLTALRLDFEGGVFGGAALPPPPLGQLIVAAAVGNFDNDPAGKQDYIGGTASGVILMYTNQSASESVTAAQWANPAFVLPPVFTESFDISMFPPEGAAPKMALAAGDFDGKGNDDIVRVNIVNGTDTPASVDIWLNNGTASTVDFQPKYTAITAADLTAGVAGGTMPGRGSNVVAVDYDGDFRLDLLVGIATSTGGKVHRFRNVCTPDPASTPDPYLDCLTNPTFVSDGDMVPNLGFTSSDLPVLAFADFSGDGIGDLIVSSPTFTPATFRLWKGSDPGSVDLLAFNIKTTTLTSPAKFVLAADFSLDGRADVIVGTESGANTYFFQNDRDDDPFSSPFKTQITSAGSPVSSIGFGVAIDYDNDPDNTMDILIAGPSTSDYNFFANRVSTTNYVNCAEVESDIIDLAAIGLDTTEMEVLRGELEVDVTLNGSGDSVTWYMANQLEPEWTPAAAPCVSDPTKYCKIFSTKAGRELRWKAEICPTTDQLSSPQINEVKLTFDFNEVEEQFRAGAVVNDGVAYVAAQTSVGQRGKLYAINAGLSQNYWEASEQLDAMTDAERNVYTVQTDGTSRLDFQYTGDPLNDGPLAGTMVLGLPPIVIWARSHRFGVGNTGIAKSRLGAIELSTPAVVTAPGLPVWYTLASPSDRSQVDSFISTHNDRGTLVLTASRSGMLHAFYSDPVNITDSNNGKEAWAFVPFPIANQMFGDFFASNTTVLGAPTVVTKYPDGPPSVADVKIGGALKTVAVVGDGNGGKSVSALDITETVDSGGTVLGPDPLWYATPGGAQAGKATPKPVIARVQIGGSERFIVIAATGLDEGAPVPSLVGRIVEAYDIETGALLWRFQTKCPITSDLVVYETDDTGEAGGPTIDGFMDRAAFADQCGYVYKLDPGKEVAGTNKWNNNRDLFQPDATDATTPGVDAETVLDDTFSPITLKALFSTHDTPNAYIPDTTADADGVDPDNDTDGLAPDTDLQRPIVGTIAVRTDNTTDTVLFFGTGGLENEDVAYHNAFYAVYSKDGSIRSKYVGTCSTGAPRRCEKFYGGVVATAEQVIFTRTVDPVDACDPGTSELVFAGLDENPATPGEFDFEPIPAISIAGAVVSSLFGDAGAIYVATLGGQLVRVGTPRASEAGGDSATGAGGGIGAGNEGTEIGVARPMVLMGWRQVF